MHAGSHVCNQKGTVCIHAQRRGRLYKFLAVCLAQAVRQQASLITQSKRSCGEVWAPGYESSPEGSSSEGEQQAAPAKKWLAPTRQRSEETTVPEAAAKMAAAAAQPARGAMARSAVADSPFRPRPPKQAMAGGNAAASVAPPSQASRIALS